MTVPQTQTTTAGEPLRVVTPKRFVPHNANIELCGVEQSFESNKGPRLLALDNINLKINAGEFVCIVGPSGCGKTSLLSLIAGLSFPTRGEVQLNNKPVTGPGTDRILIFQEHGLFPWLTVGQNVEFGMKMKGVPKPVRREATRYSLHLVLLASFK